MGISDGCIAAASGGGNTAFYRAAAKIRGKRQENIHKRSTHNTKNKRSERVAEGVTGAVVRAVGRERIERG